MTSAPISEVIKDYFCSMTSFEATSTVIGILNLALIGGATFLASRSFQQWKKQRIEDRKISLAEDALSAAYEAEQALFEIRNSSISFTENKFQNYLLRMNRYQDTFKKIVQISPRITIYFDQAAGNSLLNFVTIYNNIYISLDELRDYEERPQGNAEENDRDQEFNNHLKRELYWNRNEDDPTHKNIVDSREECKRAFSKILKKS